MRDSTEELYLCRLSITVSASKLNVEVLNGFQKLICDKPTDEQGQDMREFLLSFYPWEAAKVCVTAFRSDLDASGFSECHCECERRVALHVAHHSCLHFHHIHTQTTT